MTWQCGHERKRKEKKRRMYCCFKLMQRGLEFALWYNLFSGHTNINDYEILETHFPLQLQQKETSNRLGNGPNGSEEIKHHKWFQSINWKKLEAREIRPTFLPEVAGKHCVANFEERRTSMPVLDSPAFSPKSCDKPFQGALLCETSDFSSGECMKFVQP